MSTGLSCKIFLSIESTEPLLRDYTHASKVLIHLWVFFDDFFGAKPFEKSASYSSITVKENLPFELGSRRLESDGIFASW